MADYHGKTALITGGSTGIGLATAALLADRGARVMITGRTAVTLAQAAAEIGERAVTVVSDTSSTADIRALGERVRSEFGELDLLFANAAIARFVDLADMTEDVFDELFAINAKGPYFTVQTMAPMIREGGAVVLTTTVAANKGLVNSSAYAASKAAVRSMTRSFARELQLRGVRVNAVSPGPIETGVFERSLPDQAAVTAARQRLTTNNPMHRLGEPNEVAQVVAFLGFEATYTTGAELAVDGGTTYL